MAIIAIAVASVMSAFHSGLSQIRSEKQRLIAYSLAQGQMEWLSDQSMCYSANGLGANNATWSSAISNLSYNAANGVFISGNVNAPYYYNFTRQIYVRPYRGDSVNYGSANGLLKGVTVQVTYGCGMGMKDSCNCVLSSAVANNVY